MCGICGIYNLSGEEIPEYNIRRMMRTLKHRGPSDEGLLLEDQVGLGHLRLSIIDLSSAGRQPMGSDDGRYAIIFNGEIYNYIELREELRHDAIFRTQTDTEVLLNAYQHWGSACLDKFNGMFAFAIYDRSEQSIFIARDRFGIKPLYYYHDEKRFIFASEISAILTVLDKQVNPDDQAIFEYLTFNRTDQTEHTFFKDIKKLQHGHTLTVNRTGVHIQQWYALREHIGVPLDDPSEFQDLFSSAVGLRLRSDVPVGVCLSGGLDSSSIVSVLIKKYEKYDLNTFSAVYGAGVRGDEYEFIKEFSPALDNMYYTHPSSETLMQDIDAFVSAHGEPVGSTSPYAQYKVMELAKDHVVVTLDGQGADEQLAGYHYFFGVLFKELLTALKLATLGKEVYHYLKFHRSLFGLKTFFYFLLPSNLKTQVRVSQKGYITSDFFERHKKNRNVIAEKLYEARSVQDALMDHFEYKLEHLLKWEDRNSMMWSLEARVPFLDHRLVERTLASGAETAIKGGTTKHILREAMGGILPEKIRKRQDKVGFGNPQDEWFRSATFQSLIKDLLASKAFRTRGYINAGAAEKLYEKHLSGEVEASNEIWKWINLELWFHAFIDQ